MKKLVLVLIALMMITAGSLLAKASNECPMCAAQGSSSLVCAKCDLGKAHRSSSKGEDLKCCCAKCSASQMSTAECRKACQLAAEN